MEYNGASPKTWDYQSMSHDIACASTYTMLTRPRVWLRRQACTWNDLRAAYADRLDSKRIGTPCAKGMKLLPPVLIRMVRMVQWRPLVTSTFWGQHNSYAGKSMRPLHIKVTSTMSNRLGEGCILMVLKQVNLKTCAANLMFSTL